MSAPRLFAVVPAAGHSRRMGRAKLLLPLGDLTVIATLLATLQRPEIAQIVVVVRRDDEPLRSAVAACGAFVLTPAIDPPDMRDSVEHALTHLRNEFHPADTDGWLLCPADHPLLDARVLDQLLARWQQEDCRILAPIHNGRRGHPTLFCWDLADEVASIPHDEGLNRLMKAHAHEVVELSVDNESILTDLDTPADYDRLRASHR